MLSASQPVRRAISPTTFPALGTPSAFSNPAFELPARQSQVLKQIHHSIPQNLPEPDADEHEVRYFLYQLLTVESFRIAKTWPQWVLETCARWKGAGIDLRSMSKGELSKLCPINAGHWQPLSPAKVEAFPSPECRTAIGEVISSQVTRMRAQETEKERLHREWIATQRGRVRRHPSVMMANPWSNIQGHAGMHPRCSPMPTTWSPGSLTPQLPGYASRTFYAGNSWPGLGNSIPASTLYAPLTPNYMHFPDSPVQKSWYPTGVKSPMSESGSSQGYLPGDVTFATTFMAQEQTEQTRVGQWRNETSTRCHDTHLQAPQTQALARSPSIVSGVDYFGLGGAFANQATGLGISSPQFVDAGNSKPSLPDSSATSTRPRETPKRPAGGYQRGYEQSTRFNSISNQSHHVGLADSSNIRRGHLRSTSIRSSASNSSFTTDRGSNTTLSDPSAGDASFRGSLHSCSSSDRSRPLSTFEYHFEPIPFVPRPAMALGSSKATLPSIDENSIYYTLATIAETSPPERKSPAAVFSISSKARSIARSIIRDLPIIRKKNSPDL